MKFGWCLGKFGKSGDGISNVGTGSHISVEEFTKEFPIDETCVGLKCSVFFGVFERTDSGEKGMYVRQRERFSGTRARKTFSGSRCVPTMGGKESLEIGGAMDFYIGTGLFKVNTIESRGQAKVFKRGVGFTGELSFRPIWV